jgi:hypothetical protein
LVIGLVSGSMDKISSSCVHAPINVLQIIIKSKNKSIRCPLSSDSITQLSIPGMRTLYYMSLELETSQAEQAATIGQHRLTVMLTRTRRGPRAGDVAARGYAG